MKKIIIIGLIFVGFLFYTSVFAGNFIVIPAEEGITCDETCETQCYFGRYSGDLVNCDEPMGLSDQCVCSPEIEGIWGVGDDFVSNSLAYIGSAISGLGNLLYMIIGIPLAFWVINQVIGLVPRRKTKRE